MTQRRSRWGLLVSNVLLALTLAVSAIMGYLDARSSRDAVIRARSFDTLAAVRRSLRQLGPPTEDMAAILLEDMLGQGISYIAVVGTTGADLVEAGEARLELPTAQTLARLGKNPQFNGSDDGSVVQIVDRIGSPRARRLRRHLFEHSGRHRTNEHNRRPPRRRRPSELRHQRQIRKFFKGWEQWRQQGHRYLVIEFSPFVARAIERRAMTTLLLSLIAAVLLLTGAFLSWRHWLREEELVAEIATNAHLKSLGEMAAVLGHEIRNPLASLKGHGQLLVKKLAGHASEAKARLIVDEAIRIERLTQQILDFARTGTVETAPTDPRTIIEAASRELDDSRISLFLPDECPDVDLDAVRMRQVMTNMLQNALDASEADSPVTVSLSIHDENIAIEVADSGPGIPVEQRKTIFEPFHTGRVHGTGLGLTVAKRVIEGHGGTISLLDLPALDGGQTTLQSRGAMFRIVLPRHHEGPGGERS